MKKQNDLKKKFRKFGIRQGLWKTGIGFFRQCENRLFKGIELRGKAMLDVGCGDGLYMIWAAVNGASPVVGLEPLADGSGTSQKYQDIFHDAVEDLNLSNIERLAETFQDFECQPETFDVVLMAASINHLDEQMCIELRQNPKARERYSNLFNKLRTIMKPQGKLIVTDCSNKNFYSDLGFKNIFARNIEWHKHQTPKYWAQLLTAAGFTEPKISWGVNYRLHYLGIHTVPWLVSYLSTSIFRLEMHAK